MDKSGANLAGSKKANEDLPEGNKIAIRQDKYLNNMVEQDHRGLKQINKPMLGFKSYVCATPTLAGLNYTVDSKRPERSPRSFVFLRAILCPRSIIMYNGHKIERVPQE